MLKKTVCTVVLAVLFGCAGVGTGGSVVRGPEDMLKCTKEAEFRQAFSFLSGDWRVTAQGMDLDAPLYGDLAETSRDGFIDDPWTYYVVRPMDMWRYAVAGDENWQNYTLDFTFSIKRPAPTDGYRAGDTFYNYQWGRESAGCDLGAIVRYRGPDDYYMVRISSGFDHVELWKTRGGILRVKPYKFEPNRDYRVSVTVSGAWIVVSVDGRRLFKYLDRIGVIPSGKVGFGVRESRVVFKEVSVKPARLIVTAPPAHRPSFHLKRWVGRDYIFDGDEPVAYITDLWGPRICEVKLLPGYMPMMLIELYPLNYSNRLNWKAGKVQFTRDGEEFAFTVPLEEEKGRASAVCHLSVRYEAGRGYVWDKRVEMTAKVDGEIMKWPMEVTDPFFYQIPMPATDKMPRCGDFETWAIWSVGEGKYGCYPLNHHYYYTESRTKAHKAGAYAISPGGVWVTTLEPEAAAVIELPEDNPYQYTGGYCMWGYDLHIRAFGQGGKKFEKGEVYKGHAKFYAWNAGEVANAMLRATVPSPAGLERLMFIYEEPVNSFRRLMPLGSACRERLWEGDYSVDNTMGHGDAMCMRIEAGQSARIAAMGPSQWTGPYLAPRYRVSAWVKTDSLKGKVSLGLKGLNSPSGKKNPVAELAVDGSTDWRRISFVTDGLRHSYQWSLEVKVEGEGWAWIDDVGFVPLEGAAGQ